jgi:hypothetical protein
MFLMFPVVSVKQLLLVCLLIPFWRRLASAKSARHKKGFYVSQSVQWVAAAAAALELVQRARVKANLV